ncbi:MAG: DUF371 domain-containing protein [Promethearchaeota archaeon]
MCTLIEKFTARGHVNIKAKHKSTFEFTKDLDLTPKGDCIIGVNLDKAPPSFQEKTRKLLRTHNKFKMLIKVGDVEENVIGYGHPELTLKNGNEMVFRKSSFLSDRTVLINCDKAARDFSLKFRNSLKKPDLEIEVFLYLLS